MRERIKIPAVRDKEMRNILDQFGLSVRFDSGGLRCPSCESQLTWDNVGGFVVVHGEPRLFCTATDCLEEMKKEPSHE